MKFSFLKEVKNNLKTQLVFDGNKMEIYIPSSFFEDGLAEVYGEYIRSIYIFWFKVDGKFYEVQLPIRMMFAYSSNTKYSGSIQPGMPNDKYDVFILDKGDVFCDDTMYRVDVKDVQFVTSKLIENGKMPNTIQYNDILAVTLNSLDICGVGGLDVSSLSYELLLSELYRSKNKVNEPFRIHINANPRDIYGYRTIRITKIPELSSTLSGIMGEDSNHQVAAAVINNRLRKEGKIGEEKISPVEKIIKY